MEYNFELAKPLKRYNSYYLLWKELRKQFGHQTANEIIELQLTGAIYINDVRYFSNVPQTAWDFYIGGYQPAQKWLKDRKGRTLNADDIMHYKAIVIALMETYRLMADLSAMSVEWLPASEPAHA